MCWRAKRLAVARDGTCRETHTKRRRGYRYRNIIRSDDGLAATPSDADADASADVTGMTPHDVGLADLLDAARLTDAWREELVLHGAQPGSVAIGAELTPPVAAGLDSIVDAIEAELELLDWSSRPSRARYRRRELWPR
jgi:hypothetical protein